MKVLWRKSAIESLLELDQWRGTIELPPLATYLKDIIYVYKKNKISHFILWLTEFKQHLNLILN